MAVTWYKLHASIRSGPHPSSTLVRDCRDIWWNMPDSQSSVSATSAQAPDQWWFSAATPEWESVGGIFLYYSNLVGSMTAVSQIQYYCPWVQAIELVFSTDMGNYLVLESSTGYHMTVGPLTSNASLYNPTLYKNDETVSVSALNLIFIGSTKHDNPDDSGYSRFVVRKPETNTYYPCDVRYYPTDQRYIYCYIYSGTSNSQLSDWISHLESGVPPTDPYAPLGPSGPGGGDGDMDLNGDNIPHPSAPSLGAANSGFVTLYSPSVSDLRALASYMWSGLFDIDTWRRIFADPMSAILGLSILPISVPTSGSAAITVGSQTTTVTAPVVSSQYVTVNMGSLDVKKLVGCYLDFDPYTRLSMYLPYIGFVPLSADDVMGRTVNLQYIIDVFSGSCVATLTSDGSVVGSWAGCCATQIPITSQDWSNVISGALSIAATGAALVSGATAVAPLAVAGMANTAINSQKPNISRSGSMGGSAGMLGVQTPFIIATRPKPAIPGRQNAEIGYPSFIDDELGDLEGYTVIENVHLEGIPATEAELEEIDTLLHEGVIL